MNVCLTTFLVSFFLISLFHRLIYTDMAPSYVNVEPNRNLLPLPLNLPTEEDSSTTQMRKPDQKLVEQDPGRSKDKKACDHSAAFWQSVLGDDYLQGPNPDAGLEETDNFAKCVLQRHNYYREAVGLTPLTWNKTMADIAFETSTFFIKEADCVEAHRMKFNEKHWLGENLFSFGGFPALTESQLDMCQNGKNAVDEWYKEIRNYIYPLGDEPFHKCVGLKEMGKYGHSVQMMWSKATQLGCSYASCIGCYKQDEMPKIITNCYYNAPVLQGAQAFDDKVAERLNGWEVNSKYGGLKNCTVP